MEYTKAEIPLFKNQPQKRAKDWINISSIPRRLVVVLAVSIFIAETLIMVLLSIMQPLSPMAVILVDSILLIGLVSPALYYLMFRPLGLNIAERNKVEVKI